MDIYMKELPQTILDSVATNFNCEDVAMSFLISSLTDGKPPLLADTWAIKSMVKLYVEEKISGGHNHKQLRDVCVDSFAEMLGLKDEAGSRRLKSAKLYHTKDSFFDCGDTPHHKIKRDPQSERQKVFEAKLRKWHEIGSAKMQKDIHKLMSAAGATAYERGLIEKSDRWKERFHR
jgi:glucuronyl/N-acetylglucosaminyl transferase EXT2